MEISQNALKVLKSRYLRRDSEGKIIENPEELFKRVAKSVASPEMLFSKKGNADKWERTFYRILTNFDFLPNSPTLMNAGTQSGQLSACFVIPIEDSLESIFEAIKNMALIQKTGGGTGFSFSRLRPKDSIVKTSGGRSSGPVSFMKIFDSATANIKQGGKRRGANMGVLRIDHPDILEFINAKKNGDVLSNFNLSVGVTDSFMRSYKLNKEYKLINPLNKKTTAKLKARHVFNSIAEAAWSCGDPGLLFLDTINKTHPLSEIAKIETTNPCGEIPLLEYESCNLGSINLSNMVNENKGIEWKKLEYTTSAAVRFLDNVIETNNFPLHDIEIITKNSRKIGLGVMGFAEMLIKLKIPYNSNQAIKIAEKLMSFIRENALKSSMQLAKERGVFPDWEISSHAKIGRKLRNATLTSIAPTGTISIIAGTSSGIEPLFALAYKRKNVLDSQNLIEINPLFLQYSKKEGIYTKELINKILSSGNIYNIKNISRDFKEIFQTALEIPFGQHIRIQAAFQRNVDNSVSKTVNLSQESTVDDVKKAYLLAYKLGCKGITVFRYGSRKQQLFELGINEQDYEKENFSKCDPYSCKL